MKQLSGEVKLFIVIALAKYKTPSQIVEAVKVEFGIDVTRQVIRTYNPEQSDVPARWVKAFDAARAEFHKKIDSIPIANLATRLEWLNDVAREAQVRHNHAVVMAACEQAAKEQGGVFTNRHKMELTGKDGEPIEVKMDDLRDRLARRISGIASRIAT
jgi:hypothetical protein